MGADPIQYGIYPLPGEKGIEKYIVSGGVYEYRLRFGSLQAIQMITPYWKRQGFFEQFSAWLDEERESDILPDLPSGKTSNDH